jgi:hypothetical protein
MVLANLTLDQVSFSPTFYARLFCTKVSRKAFFSYILVLNYFWRKNIGANGLKNVGEIGHIGSQC